jgi:hypothetical protein
VNPSTFLAAVQQIISCDHPEDACVATQVGFDPAVRCDLCGSWRDRSAAHADAASWNRPALLVGLGRAAADFADEALAGMSGEREAPRDSQTQLVSAEAGRASDRVLLEVFAATDVRARAIPAIAEATKSLALCLDQLHAWQESQRQKNTPVGFFLADLGMAARQLWHFVSTLERYGEWVSAARRGGAS